MATTQKSCCYVAIIPQEGFINLDRTSSNQHICYFKFGDSIDEARGFQESTANNPCVLNLPRKVPSQTRFPSNKPNAGSWLTNAVFQSRGFEPAMTSNGNETGWYKIYLRPGQIVNIRTFLKSWEIGHWNIGTPSGQTSLYNHLVNDVFVEDSKGPLSDGRGGYNSVEKEERRDSAFD